MSSSSSSVYLTGNLKNVNAFRTRDRLGESCISGTLQLKTVVLKANESSRHVIAFATNFNRNLAFDSNQSRSESSVSPTPIEIITFNLQRGEKKKVLTNGNNVVSYHSTESCLEVFFLDAFTLKPVLADIDFALILRFTNERI